MSTSTRPPGTSPHRGADGSGQRPGQQPPGPQAQGGLRIAGVTVRFTTGAGVLALLATVISAVSLPEYAGGRPSAAYLAAGAAIAVLLLASLVLHELGHVLAGRRRGSAVSQMSIGFAGATAHGDGELPGPRAQWRAALAGPLVNLAAAVVAAAGAAGLALAGADRLIWLVLVATAVINASLGVLSLIPGTGPDGGRIVRALTWARSGDPARAVAAAARAGRWSGGALMVAGLVLLLLGFPAALWLTVIGLLAYVTSRAETRRQAITTALAGLRVRDVVRLDGPGEPVQSWQTVAAFLAGQDEDRLRGVAGPGTTAFALRDFDGGPAGILTLSQLARVPAAQRDTVRLRDVATPQQYVVTTTADEPLSSLIGKFSGWPRVPAAAHTAGHALVLGEDGEPAGVLTPADLSRASLLSRLRPTAGSQPAGGADARL
jgi:Zn-dependent protease